MSTVKRHPLASRVPGAFLLVPLALCSHGCGESKVQGVRCYSTASAAPGDAGLDAAAGSDAGAPAGASACVPPNRASSFLNLADDESGQGMIDEGPALVPMDAGQSLCCYLVTFTNTVAAADP